MTALLDRVMFRAPDDPGPLVDQLDGDGDGLPELDRDPEPGRAARRRPKQNTAKSEASRATSSRQTRTGGKFTSRAAQQKQLADEIDMYAKMLALTWSLSDEECAGVLNDTSRGIADSMAALLARSDWLVERLSATTMLADVVKLLHALLPLGRAVMAHGHLTRRAAEPDGEGVERVTVATDYQQPTYAPFRPAYTG